MVGWKWIIRIPLILFWTVALLLSGTELGFLNYMAQNHVTTTITILFVSLYFFAYPLFEPFFPKFKTDGGEILQRSTKILAFLLFVVLAVAIAAIAAPGAVQSAVEGTIVAPVVSGFVGLVETIDAQRASFMMAGGLVGGLVLAILIKRVDIPKKIRMATGNPKIMSPVAPPQPLQGGLVNKQPLAPVNTGTVLVEDEVL